MLRKFWIYTIFQAKWALWYQWLSLILSSFRGYCGVLHIFKKFVEWNWKCIARPDHGASQPCILFSPPASHCKWGITYIVTHGWSNLAKNTASFVTGIWAKRVYLVFVVPQIWQACPFLSAFLFTVPSFWKVLSLDMYLAFLLTVFRNLFRCHLP